MKGLWARRGLRLFCAAAAAAAVAAGASYATTSLTTSAAATNTIQACVKDNGDVRIVASAADCKKPEHAISWNVVGPAGPAGADGAPGKDGTSVVSSPAEASACPYGGAKFVVGTAAPTFACNGTPGANGKDGADGKDGTSISSIDGLAGLTCTNGGETGTVSVAYGSSGAITLTCSASGGSTGGGGCTTTAVPNGSVDCNGVVTCNAGFADANHDSSDGCETATCGSLPHATTTCVNGQPTIAACQQGWFDVDGNPANGCESSWSCRHDNGVGSFAPVGSYIDCDDQLGTPGDASTYNLHMAMLAASSVGTGAGQSVCGGNAVVTALVGSHVSTWAFTGPAAGHVAQSALTPLCPTTSDPTWN